MTWKKAAAKPAKKGPPRIQKWYAEMSKRLGGVPSFVIKDAQKVYSAGIKETNRQGCTDLGARAPLGLVGPYSSDGAPSRRRRSDHRDPPLPPVRLHRAAARASTPLHQPAAVKEPGARPNLYRADANTRPPIVL